MKYCPKCQANVEGLLQYCDCCGALLHLEKELSFFEWQSFELAFDFHLYVNMIMKTIDRIDHQQYKMCLESIYCAFFCYPQVMLEDMNIKNHVRYYKVKKEAQITVVVDYHHFTKATEEEKKKIVVDAIFDGFEMLKIKLLKLKIDITKLIENIRNYLVAD